MARRCLLLVALAVLATAAATSDSDSNPIRPVTDRAASALESTVLAALGRTRNGLRFARFAVRYGKSYEGAAEVQRRFRIFSENLELVRSTNRRGLPYRLGINRFSDMSWEEFRASRLGAAQNCSATLAGNHRMRDAAALPETKDWREDGIVSPVKDQGHCGSCWTFSTRTKVVVVHWMWPVSRPSTTRLERRSERSRAAGTLDGCRTNRTKNSENRIERQRD